jgi:ABC-2 type transport system permease protein
VTRAIYVLSLRQLAGRWRVAVLVVLCALPFVVASVAGTSSDPPSTSDLDKLLLNGLIAASILPIVALSVATAALGNELSDRTLGNLTLAPVSHARIVLAKLAAAVTISVPLLAASGAGSMLLAYRLLGLGHAGRAAAAVGIATAAGAAAYSALFLWAGLVTSHPLVLGLLYVFVWEGLFGTFVSGIRYLSIRQYTLGIAKAVDASRLADTQHVLGTGSAIVGAAIVACGFTALAVRRLRRMDVP